MLPFTAGTPVIRVRYMLVRTSAACRGPEQPQSGVARGECAYVEWWYVAGGGATGQAGFGASTTRREWYTCGLYSKRAGALTIQGLSDGLWHLRQEWVGQAVGAAAGRASAVGKAAGQTCSRCACMGYVGPSRSWSTMRIHTRAGAPSHGMALAITLYSARRLVHADFQPVGGLQQRAAM